MTCPQNAHDFVHVILIGTENRYAAANLLGKALARIAVEHLHAHAHKKYRVPFAESRYSSGEGGNISRVGGIDFAPGPVKINRAVMTLFIRAHDCSRSGLRK